jgi:hypothetical protein
MKAKTLFLLIGLLAFVLALAIAPAVLAKSTPVLTTMAQSAIAADEAESAATYPPTATSQVAFTTIHATLFVAGLVVGLLFFGLVRTAVASRIEGRHLAVGMSRHVTEPGHRTRGTTA